jgi:hypothetical protein
MESLVDEAHGKQKTTSGYLRKAERVVRLLRANLTESGLAIETLRMLGASVVS